MICQNTCLRSRQCTRTLAAVLLFAFTGCTTLEQLAKFQKPQVAVHNIRLQRISFKSVDLLFQIAVKNPNAVAIQLAGFDYELFVNENSFLTGKQQSRLRIAASDESLVDIPLTMQFSELYRTISSLRHQEQSTYKANFGFEFDLPVLGPTRVPVSASGTLPLVKVPSLRVQGLRLKKLSISQADLELNLGIENPNAFFVDLQKLDYAFSVNGMQWARGTTTRALRINGKGSSSIAIPIRLDLLNAGRAVLNFVRGGQTAEYALSGSLNLQTSLPLLKSATLPLKSSGRLKIAK